MAGAPSCCSVVCLENLNSRRNGDEVQNGHEFALPKMLDRRVKGASSSDRLFQIRGHGKATLLAQPRVKRLLSTDHFSVDGTMIQTWASMKSVKPIAGSDEPPPAGGRNDEMDFRARPLRMRRMLRRAIRGQLGKPGRSLASGICVMCFGSYAEYYNGARTHLSLTKNYLPLPDPSSGSERIRSRSLATPPSLCPDKFPIITGGGHMRL